MAISFNRLVQSDVRIVLQYYETVGGNKLADRFFAELTAMVGAIEQRPTTFHLTAQGLRRANLPSFPYHLLFREKAGLIRVLVLRHHRRLPIYGTKRV